MLYFAYGSNMSRAVMGTYAPDARPLGIAALAGHRFVITAAGYASIEPLRTATVHGVLWRITPRDRTRLDGWENVASGLYRAETLAVHHAGRRCKALIYKGRPASTGMPKAGYMELVIAAAQAWNLPAAYVESLRVWLPVCDGVSSCSASGEFRWT